MLVFFSNSYLAWTISRALSASFVLPSSSSSWLALNSSRGKIMWRSRWLTSFGMMSYSLVVGRPPAGLESAIFAVCMDVARPIDDYCRDASR